MSHVSCLSASITDALKTALKRFIDTLKYLGLTTNLLWQQR